MSDLEALRRELRFVDYQIRGVDSIIYCRKSDDYDAEVKRILMDDLLTSLDAAISICNKINGLIEQNHKDIKDLIKNEFDGNRDLCIKTFESVREPYKSRYKRLSDDGFVQILH